MEITDLLALIFLNVKAEESACGKLHDPAFNITEIYFQEKLLCNFLVKNGNY